MKKRIWAALSCLVLALTLALGFAACDNGEKKPLATPENVLLSDGALSWDPVEGAVDYTVRIGTDESTVLSETSLKLKDVKDKLKVGKNSLSVRANETEKNAASEYSSKVTYNYEIDEKDKVKLGKPMNLKLTGSVLSWDAVTNASGYTVTIGAEETLTTDTNSIDFSTDEAKERLVLGPNAVSVRANGTGYYLDSDESEFADGYTFRKPFDVPSDVKVEGYTLSWGHVTGGLTYTVKINDDETTVVTPTDAAETITLDLMKVKGKLKEENTLSVKVNENPAMYFLASEYSSPVTYHYNAEAVAKAEAFIDRVENIATLSQTNTQTEAAAIKEVIDSALQDYTTLAAAEEVRVLLTAAKASLDEKNTAYETEMAAANAAYTGYQGLLAAAKTASGAGEDATVTALENAVNALNAKKLSTLADGLVQDDEKTDAETLSSTLAQWKEEVATALRTLTDSVPALDPKDDGTAEAVIKKVGELLEAYETYGAYVKADAQIAAAHGDLTAARDRAMAQIKTTVDALKADIADAVQKNTDPTPKNYQVVLDLETRIAALGEYAQSIFGTESEQDLSAMKTKMLQTIVAVEKDEKVLYNSNNDEAPVLVLTLKYVNLVGENMKPESDPVVTAKETVTGGEETPLSPSTPSFDDERKLYVISISFTRIGYNQDIDTTVSLSYTVSDSFEQNRTTELELASPRAIVYFSENNNEAYIDEKLTTVYGANESQEILFDLYLSSDLTVGARNDNVGILGAPIASGTKDTFAILESLRHFAALAGHTGDVSVRLLAYQRWEDEDGKTYISAINCASVSAPIELKGVTAEEAKETLPMPKFQGATELNLQAAVKDGSLAKLLGLEKLTNEEASKLLQLHIEVTHKEETKDFYVPIASDYVQFILSTENLRQPLWELFGDGEEGEYALKIRTAFTEEGSRLYGDTLRESYPVTYKYSGKLVVNNEKLKPNLENGKWNLGDPNGNITYKWELVTTDGDLHDGALIYIFDTNGIDDVQTHEFTAEDAFAVYHINSKAFVSWNSKSGDNAPIMDVIRSTWLEKLRTEQVAFENITYAYSFVFAIGLVPNELGEALGYQPSDLVYATKDNQREVKEITFTQDDVKAPNIAQFGFANAVDVEFLNPDGMTRGAIFSVYNADHVELKFTKGEQEYTVYLFDEDGALAMYGNAEKTTSRFGCETVANGWTSAGKVSGKINEWYGVSINIQDGWEARTRVIINEDSVYLFSGEWSDPVTYQAS